MTIDQNIYKRSLWASITILSGYYLYRAILFNFTKKELEKHFGINSFFYLVTALPLTLGPRFRNWFRIRYTMWHRLLGKIYIVSGLLVGISAFALGALQPYEGSVVPVVILSALWMFMTIAAWITIRNSNIKAHRLFMIRSYALALTFVWLRILSDLVYRHNMLSFIKDQEIRDATYEWMSWVLPLLLVNLFISWRPLMKHKTTSANSGFPQVRRSN